LRGYQRLFPLGFPFLSILYGKSHKYKSIIDKNLRIVYSIVNYVYQYRSYIGSQPFQAHIDVILKANGRY